MPKKLTANTGASRTRASIKRKVEEIRENELNRRLQLINEVDDLLAFIRGQAVRNAARKGGLGRK